jgi:hypothetical protein
METATNYKFYSFQQIPQDNYNRAMKELAAKFQQALKDNLAKPFPYSPGYLGKRAQQGKRNMKVKTGSLYNSIQSSFDPESNKIKVKMLDYWKYVNDGRKPGHYVPLEPLVAWIKTKGLNRDKGGKFKKIGSYRGLAARISKSIYKFGIQPTNFYDDSFDIFIKEFDDPNGPAAQLGIDLQEFLINIIQQPVE